MADATPRRSQRHASMIATSRIYRKRAGTVTRKFTLLSLRNKKVKNMHIPKSDCIADAYSLLLLPSRHCCHCQNFVVNCHGFYGDQDSQMPQTPTYDVAAAQPSDLRIVAHLVGVLAAYSVHADFIHLLQVPVQLSLGI
ncbi:PREDICTED: uncharacterized protein LOC109156851 isoform X1 [Ipomoea nil]|uniref:uncharacterized protein LOC109156851 isoform X1 n=1 Tax=Ipomoea nil TaxID=35883 RepID=UPI000901771F|nr:PREDICTED: uncharacterized protein LOC109156851 isoform X1 [Ipomoea nil]